MTIIKVLKYLRPGFNECSIVPFENIYQTMSHIGSHRLKVSIRINSFIYYYIQLFQDFNYQANEDTKNRSATLR